MPAPLAARSIGYYTAGCLAGGVALPINGKTWQVMRLSRNRNWGHPNLIQFLERFAEKVPSVGWPGLLVGDLAQPRGGPMLTGHTANALVWVTGCLHNFLGLIRGFHIRKNECSHTHVQVFFDQILVKLNESDSRFEWICAEHL